MPRTLNVKVSVRCSGGDHADKIKIEEAEILKGSLRNYGLKNHRKYPKQEERMVIHRKNDIY
jgi:hypothetical protein